MNRLHKSTEPAGIFVPLSLATTIATYLLIAVGALVRAAGAGLGCPDWPRCFGSWVPPTRIEQLPAAFDASQFNVVNTWLEYVNRLIGVFIGFLILATLIAAWRRYRRVGPVFWPTLASFLLVGFQGWLGGQVVEHGLDPNILTAHMIVAFIIVGLLLYAHLCARFGPIGDSAPASRKPLSPGLRRVGALGWLVSFLVLIQVGLGTRVRSVLQDLEKAGVERIDWLPLDWWPDLAHRQFAVIVAAACGVLVWSAMRHGAEQPALKRWAGYILAMTLAQIAAGLGMAYGAVPPPLQVVHLALSSLLFGALSVLLFMVYRGPATERRSP
ncbi:MAG: COX15/CtaA family protein [Myxococcota bacterium]